MEKITLKTITHKIETTDCVKLVFLGDTHIGAQGCDEDLIKQTVSRIQEDNTYFFDMGDRCEFINSKDPRFEFANLPQWLSLSDLVDIPKAQINRFVDLFKSISEKCLGTVEGNHEASIKTHSDRDVYQQINEQLKFDAKVCLGTSGIVRLQFMMYNKVEWTLDVFLHHGSFGCGKKSGSAVNGLEELPLAIQADVFCVGHTHKKLGKIQERVRLNNKGKLVHSPIALINSGSFVRGFTDNDFGSYAEKRLLYPQGIGPVELWVYPEQKQVKLVV